MDSNNKEITKPASPTVHIHIGPVYPCNYCSMCFINMVFLNRHKSKCINKKLFTILKVKLQMREKIKLEESPLYNFQTFKQREKRSPFVCEICQKDCHNQTCLFRHYKTHKDHTYTCEFCDKKFVKLFKYKKHKTIHMNQEKISCFICEESFQDISSYKDHMKNHSKQLFTHCEYCFKPFEKGEDMAEHAATHTGKSPYVCTECNSRCTSQSLLIKHLATHKGLSPFQCGFCKKKFTRFYFYTNHLRIHTGEKPFKCIHCDKTFSQYSHLKQHTSETHVKKKKEDVWYNILTLQKNTSPLLYKSIARKFLYKNDR